MATIDARTSSLYLSRVLGRPIVDRDGQRAATIRDLVARFGSEPHPAIVGLVARQGRRDFFLAWSGVAELTDAGARLATFKVDLQPFTRREGEVLLRRDVLDKQLIDVNGRRLIRANDLLLEWVAGDWRLVGVDVSAHGLWRRLAPSAMTRRVASRRLIDWEDVESFATDVPMVRLRAPHERLARLHPAEIARIVETLPFHRGQEILAAVDDRKAADIVEELAPEHAAGHLGALDPERAADILAEMEPDEAADVLGDLPKEHAADLLDRMEPAESEDVRELLAYEDDTAAGLMTTDFVALPEALTAGEALARLRVLPEPPALLFHIYLVEREGSERLVGAVSLRDLVLAAPETPLGALARADVHAVGCDDAPAHVGHLLAEYNLPDVPVTSEGGEILGVISIDDVLDALSPGLHHRRRHRLRRLDR